MIQPPLTRTELTSEAFLHETASRLACARGFSNWFRLCLQLLDRLEASELSAEERNGLYQNVLDRADDYLTEP